MTMTLTPIPPGFWTEGSCHDLPADWFHPERGESTTNAKGVCATCPIRIPCLEWALDNHEKFGIWGGTSERERRRINHRVHDGQLVPELTPDWTPQTRVGAPKRSGTDPDPPAPKEERSVELTVAAPPVERPPNGTRPAGPAEPRTDACVNCGKRYTPVQKDQRFHSKECARAWYASHPKTETGTREPRIRSKRVARISVAKAVAPATVPATVPDAPDTALPLPGAVSGAMDLHSLLGQLLAGCDHWTIEADLGDVHVTVTRDRP